MYLTAQYDIKIMLLFSWTCTDESPTSGLTMLVVDIPSGYIMLQVNYDDNDVHCTLMMMMMMMR